MLKLNLQIACTTCGNINIYPFEEEPLDGYLSVQDNVNRDEKFYLSATNPDTCYIECHGCGDEIEFHLL